MDFLLRDWLNISALLDRPRFAAHSADSIDAIMALAQDLAERELVPLLRPSDIEEPSMDVDGRVRVLPAVARAVQLLSEAGLFASVFDEALGGLQLPHTIYFATLGILMSATIATSSFMLLTVGNARLIVSFGNAAQIAAFAQPPISGRAMGTMCLSEPQAGSSLSDIRTRAAADGEDALGERYRITGSKMWISGGDHDVTTNIVHLVLAKVPDSSGRIVEGTQGISLFIVPKVLPDGGRNDITTVALNHKMGYRGLPNCALNFGEGRHQPAGGAGAVGWLVGKVGEGLPQMFQMMNEARISVGMGGAMLAYRGYLMSLDYARDRRQGRAVGDKNGAPVAIIEHADVKRMLLAQKAYAEGALALVLYSARLLDEQNTAETEQARQSAGELLALLTPVAKSWPAEWAQQSLNLAIQIHGGAGYTRDFEVEQLYRDNRLNAIHEGTTGIQALDLVGRKLRRYGAGRPRRTPVTPHVYRWRRGRRSHSATAAVTQFERFRRAFSRLDGRVNHAIQTRRYRQRNRVGERRMGCNVFDARVRTIQQIFPRQPIVPLYRDLP
jgi:alkylation response protein AidB-like acyl-CoA dehydrogenase